MLLSWQQLLRFSDIMMMALQDKPELTISNCDFVNHDSDP
jgi:hypothetical protein